MSRRKRSIRVPTQHRRTESVPATRAKPTNRIPETLPLDLIPTSPSSPQQTVPQPPRPRLPTEVCERIIDFLAGELSKWSLYSISYDEVIGTLHACSCVCHAWTTRSRLHLLGVIRSRCYPGSLYDDKCTADFLTRESRLRTRVHTLQIEVEYDSRGPILNTVPLRLAKPLASISHLRLENAVLCCVPAFFPALRQFNNIIGLSLIRIEIWSLSDLRRTVTAFPALQTLQIFHPEVHRISDTQPVTVPRTFPPCKARLHTLRIGAETAWLADPRSLYWLNWLSKSGICSDLKELRLGYIMILEEQTLAAVDSIVRTSKDSLEVLQISLSPDLEVVCCECLNCHADPRALIKACQCPPPYPPVYSSEN